MYKSTLRPTVNMKIVEQNYKCDDDNNYYNMNEEDGNGIFQLGASITESKYKY